MPEYVYVIIGVLIGGLMGWIRARYFSAESKPRDNSMYQSKQLVGQIREIVQSQLLNNHPRLFQAIAKQKMILNEQNRSSIAIFLSPKIFKELMVNENSYSGEQIELLYESMRDLRMPVGFLGDLPIYISELMTDSPVFVVGSISWEM